MNIHEELGNATPEPDFSTFTIATGLKRLLAGEPPEFIYGKPKRILGRVDMARAIFYASDQEKAVKGSLFTALAVDASAHLSNFPLSPDFSEFSFPSFHPVTPAVLTSAWSLAMEVSDEAHSTITSMHDPEKNDSIFSRTLFALRAYYEDETDVRDIICSRLRGSVQTLKDRFSPYFNLIVTVGESKTVEEFCNAIKASTAIFGRPAAHGLHYFNIDNAFTRGFSDAYDPRKYEKRIKENGQTAVVIKREVREEIEARYSGKEAKKFHATCPANIGFKDPTDPDAVGQMSLINAIVQRTTRYLSHVATD